MNTNFNSLANPIICQCTSLVLLCLLAASHADAAMEPELSDAFNGQAAPVFTATSLDGKAVSLAANAGHVVLVNFFATWCPPCKKEITQLQQVQAKYPNLVIIGVVSDNLFSPADPEDHTLKEARSLVEAKKITYPLVLATEQLGKDYHFKGIPTTVIVDSKGIIQKVIYGFNDAAVFEQFVAGLIPSEPVKKSEQKKEPATQDPEPKNL